LPGFPVTPAIVNARAVRGYDQIADVRTAIVIEGEGLEITFGICWKINGRVDAPGRRRGGRLDEKEGEQKNSGQAAAPEEGV